jgi:hypothetical protein
MLPKTSLYFFGALLIGTTLPANATPNVYWHHLHSSVSQKECLDKAEVVMLAERAGRIVKDDDSVRSWSDKTTGIVECLKTESGLMVMVLVASDDAHEASHLQENLEKAIPK